MELLHEFFMVPRAFESSGSLVVHFGSGGDTVKSKHDHFVGFEDIDEHVNIVEDIQPNFFHLFG